MDEKREREREKERDNETCAMREKKKERGIKGRRFVCCCSSKREREKREHTSHALAHARWVVLFVFLSLFAQSVVVHHDDDDDFCE